MPVNRAINPWLPHRHLPTDDSQRRWLDHHSILLGAWAWQGFEEHGRGLVWIRATTMTSEPGAWPWSTEARLLEPIYITSANAWFVISSLPCEHSRRQISIALQTYQPSTDAIAWLQFAKQPLVLQLHNMKVPPRAALRQLDRRRDEFEIS
ncbi:MAG: hypothetical protein CL862_02060 [Cyanobium sp. NAT70]|nr:hypothetical protein [Cyanobium sp. NAT70]|tara:strand:+ start:2552 stop:3004 length:453 start_codon:yes stop_codon:yes gene_type:complete